MKFEGTSDLPTLKFTEDEGWLSISGRATAVRAKEDFWEPLLNKLEDYLKEPRDMVLFINFEYFSTSSAKGLLSVMQLMEEKIIIDNKRKLLIKWYYDDDEMAEAGEDYSQMVPKPNWKFIKNI